MLPRFVIIAICVGAACGATWIGFTPPKPKSFDHKEGCYVEEINDVIPFGSTVTPIGHCFRVACGKGMMDYASCGVVGTEDPKCHITDVDLSKPYPDCCRNVKCDLDNELNEID